jgi:hypothetical protein
MREITNKNREKDKMTELKRINKKIPAVTRVEE